MKFLIIVAAFVLPILANASARTSYREAASNGRYFLAQINHRISNLRKLTLDDCQFLASHVRTIASKGLENMKLLPTIFSSSGTIGLIKAYKDKFGEISNMSDVQIRGFVCTHQRAGTDAAADATVVAK